MCGDRRETADGRSYAPTRSRRRHAAGGGSVCTPSFERSPMSLSSLRAVAPARRLRASPPLSLRSLLLDSSESFFLRRASASCLPTRAPSSFEDKPLAGNQFRDVLLRPPKLTCPRPVRAAKMNLGGNLALSSEPQKFFACLMRPERTVTCPNSACLIACRLFSNILLLQRFSSCLTRRNPSERSSKESRDGTKR
jgi:hypothetical protein